MTNTYYCYLLREFKKNYQIKFPLCIEIAPPVVKQVIKTGESMDLKLEIRQGTKVAALARSPQGNLLVDAFSSTWNDIDKIVSNKMAW